jgi:Ca-activated chloride channel homolog
LVPVLAILGLVLRRQRPEVQWSGLIAPHLLRHLLVKPERKWRIQPAKLVATALTIAILALSGPTWRRELPPFVEDKAPLMIALAVNASMNERDVAPSRLERAKQKIRDLLSARMGARNGLIAYAGTAHLVMPLTDDRSLLEPFLAALAPALMPVDGKNAAAAVALAASAMAREPVPGTILLVADDVSGFEQARLRTTAGHNGLVILSVTPSRTEPSRLGDAVAVSIDGSDVSALERRIETHFQAARTDQFGGRWQDEGYWLLLPVALLSLVWFRRGTTVPWIVLLLTLLHNGSAAAQDSSGSRNLWLTPDQQGRLAFDRGDYAAAKRLFIDPMWRGLAAYRASTSSPPPTPSKPSPHRKGSLRSAMPRHRTTPTRRPLRPMTRCSRRNPTISPQRRTAPSCWPPCRSRRKGVANRRRGTIHPARKPTRCGSIRSKKVASVFVLALRI